MKEMPVLQRILVAVSRGATRLFRNNVGQAWVGARPHQCRRPETITLRPGDVVVRQARPFHAGLCVGSSDTIGWTTVEITPEWVGRRVAVFTGIEVKGDGGRASDDQLQFIGQVQAAGGIAGVARSADEAQGIIEAYRSSG